MFLFLFLDSLLILGLIVGWKQFFLFQNENFGSIIGATVVLFLVSYCTFYIFINRIVFANGVLSVRYLKPGLPKVKAERFDSQNIKTVYIGNKKYVMGLLHENRSWKTESKKFYKQFISHRYPGASDVSRFALSFMDVLVICTKDDEVAIISTKPFSAAGFRRLIMGLRGNGIKVLVGSKILNRRLK